MLSSAVFVLQSPCVCGLFVFVRASLVCSAHAHVCVCARSMLSSAVAWRSHACGVYLFCVCVCVCVGAFGVYGTRACVCVACARPCVCAYVCVTASTPDPAREIACRKIDDLLQSVDGRFIAKVHETPLSRPSRSKQFGNSPSPASSMLKRLRPAAHGRALQFLIPSGCGVLEHTERRTSHTGMHCPTLSWGEVKGKAAELIHTSAAYTCISVATVLGSAVLFEKVWVLSGAHAHAHTHTHTHARASRTHARTHACTHAHIRTHTYARTIHARMTARTHARKHTHTHTRTHS